jgi:hypothetical protein
MFLKNSRKGKEIILFDQIFVIKGCITKAKKRRYKTFAFSIFKKSEYQLLCFFH